MYPASKYRTCARFCMGPGYVRISGCVLPCWSQCVLAKVGLLIFWQFLTLVGNLFHSEDTFVMVWKRQIYNLQTWLWPLLVSEILAHETSDVSVLLQEDSTSAQFRRQMLLWNPFFESFSDARLLWFCFILTLSLPHRTTLHDQRQQEIAHGHRPRPEARVMFHMPSVTSVTAATPAAPRCEARNELRQTMVLNNQPTWAPNGYVPK